MFFCHHNPPSPPPFRKVISPYQLICHHRPPHHNHRPPHRNHHPPHHNVHPPHHNHHPPHHNHHHCHHNFQTKSQPTPSPTTMEPPATAGKTQDLDQKPEILLRCLLVMIIMVMIKIIMIIPWSYHPTQIQWRSWSFPGWRLPLSFRDQVCKAKAGKNCTGKFHHHHKNHDWHHHLHHYNHDKNHHRHQHHHLHHQGTWKDIVNVADYTQTLRMEKCL